MGIELLNFLKKKKKDQPSNGNGLKTLEPEKVPEYQAGIQEDKKSIVRLVSNKKVKNHIVSLVLMMSLVKTTGRHGFILPLLSSSSWSSYFIL